MSNVQRDRMALAIEANDLIKTYPPDVRALDGVSLSVPTGTIFALLGPNGAGKSTTVRILTTLSRPDSGSARVAGIDVLAEPVRVRHAIGVVGQKHGLDPEATGRENLVLQGELYGITGRELRRRAAEALERFGLTDAAKRQAKTYSGGMQRRLDVAMGLIHHPQVLFLDEPTTGLDPEARAGMWHEIELADGDDTAARAALEDVAGVGHASLDGRTLRARARNAAVAMPAVLAAFDAHGIEVASVTLARPSLDDVYLHYAG